MHTPNLKENGLLQPVHLLSERGRGFLTGFLHQNGKTLTIFRVACLNLVLIKSPWSLKPLF